MNAPPPYIPSDRRYPVNLDSSQLGWLYAELTDLRKSFKFTFDFLNYYPQRPFLDSIIKEVSDTLLKIYKEEH